MHLYDDHAITFHSISYVSPERKLHLALNNYQVHGIFIFEKSPKLRFPFSSSSSFFFLSYVYLLTRCLCFDGLNFISIAYMF